MSPRYNQSAKSGNLNSVVATTVTPGNTVDTTRVARGSLSALVTVKAETDTLTITAKWQVSNDGSTWVDVALPNNAANVALATGTSAADAAVTRAIMAPDAVYGWHYTRVAIVNGVATGASTDTYSMSYCYLPFQVDAV